MLEGAPKPRRNRPVPFATLLAFFLCLSFCSILGYGIHRFFSVVATTHAASNDFVFEVRGAIYALSVITAIACIMLGFAIFMIGSRGEFQVSSDIPGLKGIVSASAPGLFFVLCGTVIIAVMLSTRFEYEASDVSNRATPPVSDASTPNPQQLPASRDQNAKSNENKSTTV